MGLVGALVGFGLLVVAPFAAARAELPSIVPRIANGVASTAWPEVGVLISNAGQCTATFIGCRSAVTAAHCVCDPSGTGAACGGGEFLIDPALSVFFASQGGFFPIDRIRIPSNFAFGVQGDIAILDLATEVRSIRPRRINEVGRVALGTSATIVGFGRSQDATIDGGIKRVGAVATANCSGSGVSDATHLCWNFLSPIGPAGTDSNICPGDSGGPLLVNFGAGPTLAGVHSGGNGICNISGSSFDTDVFVARTWLRDQVGVDLDATSCGSGAQVGDAQVTTFAFDGATATQTTREFQVPFATKVLRVALNGTPDGDLDLYLKPGSAPTPFDSACASAFSGSFEYCEVEDPNPGNWFALANLVAGGSTPFQLIVTLLPESPAPPPFARGQIAVSNFTSFELIQVNAADGARVVASAPLRGSGPALAGPEGLAVDRDRKLLIANPYDRNLLRVDPQKGDRQVVSGCTDTACASTIGSGPAFLSPRFVALERDRRILVADRSVPGTYAVVRVDPSSGNRSVVSGCANAGCTQIVGVGPAIARLFGIAVNAQGAIFVVDGQALYRIDPGNGNRTLLSGCTDAACTSTVGIGPASGAPTDLVIDRDGAIFVTYQIEGASFGALRQIDPATGERTLVSGCENAGCSALRGAGPRFDNLFGIALDFDHTLVVADSTLNAVFRVDAVSGNRTLVSGCADLACSSARGAGAGFGESIDVALIPEPGAIPLAIGAIAALRTLVRRRVRREADAQTR